MILILTLIDWILFVPLALCVAYLLVYAIASKYYRAPHYPEADKLHRIAVFFPAYREDKVIIDSVRSFLEQDYPKEMYDVPTKTVPRPKPSYWPSAPSRKTERRKDWATAN